MRILTVGESPTINSGFANVLRELNNYFILEGHEVAQLGWCKFDNKAHEYPYKIYPVVSPVGPENYYGVNIFDDVVKDFKPDIVFSLGDPYMLTWIPSRKTRPTFKWILYTPIDSTPLPSVWNGVFADADALITYSKFGEKALSELDIKYKMNPYMIYHGYNPKDFYVIDEEGRAEIRELNNYTDKTVFGYIGTNSTRKHPERLLETWAKFSEDKDDVILLMHAGVCNEREGFDLREMLYQYPKIYDTTIFMTGASPVSGVPVEMMNKLYNIIDIFVSGASCEGFGLPFLEAAACGVPCIGVDYSSIPELIGSWGELVKPKTFYRHKPLCQARPLFDIDDFVDKMNKLYLDVNLRKSYSEKCLEFAATMTWDHILPNFSKVLDDVITLEVSTQREVKTRYVEV
jgi:glycosyltransferase involved in cell wall biosynthesis